FLVLWLKLVKDFLKVRCRLALLPFLISCLIWLDLVASLPLIKERILVIILLLHFLSLGALTYTDIAGDPVLYGNLPPREISMKDVFRSGDSSKKFKIAEGQWYRYAPSYVSPAYHLLEGFPFIQEP